MMSRGQANWRKVRLGGFISVLTDYHANGSYQKLRENVTLLDEPGYALMIRTTNFERNDFSNDLRFISETAYNFLSKSKVFPNDILMNKIASAGSVYLMPDLQRPVSLGMNLFLIRMNSEYTDQRYVYYYLKENEDYIKLYAVGTAAKTITKQAVRDLEIRLPPLPTQRRIAAILWAYDDIIENNQRRINILEDMAQNIYREWFVKFRFPGHRHVRFTDSLLGPIPEGWVVRELSEFVDFERGVEPGSKNYASRLTENSIQFLRVGDLGKRTSNIFIDRSLAKGRILRPNDIAITMDGTVGLVSMGLTGAYSSGIRRLVPKPNCTIGNAFLFLLLQSDRIQAIIESHSKGTTIKHASSSIGHMSFVLPDKGLAEAFEEYAGPLNSLVLSLRKRNDVLRRTSALILSRLISGSLDVSELDIAVPEEADS